MRIHHGTLGALLTASLLASASGCGGTQRESGAGAAFLNGADEAEFQAGLTAQQSGDAAEAERRFGRALAANPNFLSARIALGNLQLVQGRHAEAASSFDAAIATRSTSVDGLIGAADARLHLDQCDRSTPLAERVVNELASAATPAQRSLALTILGRCNEQGNQELAQDYFQRAVTTHPSNTDARLALADLFMRTGTATEVVTSLARAEEYERRPGYLLRIGKMLAAVHQSRRAVAVLTRAQQAAPKDDDVAVALADAQLEVGDGNLAIQTLTDVLERSPGRRDAQVLMGHAELAAGRAEPARRRAVAVLEGAPDDAGSHHLMALLAQTHDDNVTAEAELRRALSADASLVPAKSALAEILAKREAWDDLVVLVRDDADRAWAPAVWGDLLLQAYRALGRVELVLPLLSRAADERGSDPEAHAEVADLALRNPKILDAAIVIRHARAAFERSGGNVTRYRILLIDALAASEQIKEASALVDAGLKATPGNRELLQRRQGLRR